MDGRRARIIEGLGPAAAVLALGFVASLIVNFPGHFTPDSVWQLAQGREGAFDDWHPPIMAWLLGLADRATPGAWAFIVGQALLFYGALFAIVALERRSRPAGVAILVLWMVSPIVLIYQGIALKDVLFADLALAAFAALAWAVKVWDRRWLGPPLLALALSLFALAALTRQNGLIAPLLGALALGAIVFNRTRRQPWRRRAAVAVGVTLTALVMVGALDMAATAGFRAHAVDGPQEGRHLKVLQVFDLAGAVHADPALPLPRLQMADPKLAQFVRQSAAPAYRASGADYMAALPGGPAFLESPERAADDQWRRLILDRPWLYLRVRGEVWLNTLLTPLSASCPMILTGVDADPPMLAAAGLRARRSAKDDADEAYATALFSTPLYSHAVYGLLILIGLGLGLRRRLRGNPEPDLIVMLCLGAAALAFTASFFFVSIACDYRFLYFLDVAAMAVVTREAVARA